MPSSVSTDMLTLLSTRRSVPARLLADPAPSDEELRTLLTIAARVPDHGRSVPWRFLVIERAKGEQISALIEQLYVAEHPEADAERRALERSRLARAPLVVTVISRTYEHPKATEWEQILSAGAVCMNLVTAVNAMGYGCVWLTEWYATNRQVLDALGLAPNERIAGFIHIGTPLERPSDRPRPVIEEIVSYYR